MGEPRTRRATYADIEAAPAGSIAEIVAGELHVQPRPAVEHAGSASVLGGANR
jgi:hypothetical protein